MVQRCGFVATSRRRKVVLFSCGSSIRVLFVRFTTFPTRSMSLRVVWGDDKPRPRYCRNGPPVRCSEGSLMNALRVIDKADWRAGNGEFAGRRLRNSRIAS